MFRASFVLYVALCFLSLLSWNCTKIDTTGIGAGLIPAVDNVTTFDTTLAVIANNFDSAANNCFTFYPEDDHILGFIKSDPLFGTSQSTIYTELKPVSYPFNFPANSTLDSVVLVLSYKSSFGDTTVPQKVNVYQLSGTFAPDSSSCKSYNYDAPLLGSAIYTPQQLNDSVKGFRELSSNQLRIRLDNAFGESLLSHGPAAAFASDSAFKIFLKGFAIVPDVSFGGNALNYFSLADTNTKLSVYYRSTNTTTDTTVTNFRFTRTSASANHVTRNHAGAEIASHQGKPPLGDEEIYIQTTPGTFAEIKIPDLTNMPNRIIHRATLTMDQVYDDNPLSKVFATPFVLYLDLHDTSSADNDYKPIPCDFNTLSGSPDLNSFGGFRTIAKDQFGHDISRYTFNLSRYVQKIVTNKRVNENMRLRAPDNIVNTVPYVDECGQTVVPFIYPVNLPAFGRVRLGGGNNPNFRMKMYIVYSNI